MSLNDLPADIIRAIISTKLESIDDMRMVGNGFIIITDFKYFRHKMSGKYL